MDESENRRRSNSKTERLWRAQGERFARVSEIARAVRREESNYKAYAFRIY